MKCVHYETISNAAWYYQTAFTIHVILGKSSNHKNVLKDQVNTRKEVQSVESKMILKPRMRANANECAPNALDDNEVIIESK